MKVLALDVSTKTGFAVLQKDGEAIVILESGSHCLDGNVESLGEYPLNFVLAANHIAQYVHSLVERIQPEWIVIEEVNLAKARFSQKLLDALHAIILSGFTRETLKKVRYVSTSDWRGKTLGLSVAATKKAAKPLLKTYADEEKRVAALPKGKGKKEALEKLKAMKMDLKKRCVWGKIDKKSISVAYVNATYGKNLLKGQNDESDAICLGTAFLKGSKTVDNSVVYNHKEKQ